MKVLRVSFEHVGSFILLLGDNDGGREDEDCGEVDERKTK